jgi:HSP20 family molecular chaperone IbpA
MTTQTFPGNGAEVSEREQTRRGQYYRPNVDVIERADELLVIADVPGAKRDQIDIEFEHGSLTIHARVAERRPENATYLVREFGVGDFYRTFRVSEQIDPARITAEYRDGVLSLHLPKSEAAKPRKIAIEPARASD